MKGLLILSLCVFLLRIGFPVCNQVSKPHTLVSWFPVVSLEVDKAHITDRVNLLHFMFYVKGPSKINSARALFSCILLVLGMQMILPWTLVPLSFRVDYVIRQWGGTKGQSVVMSVTFGTTLGVWRWRLLRMPVSRTTRPYPGYAGSVVFRISQPRCSRVV